MSSYCEMIECNCKYHDEEEGCMYYYLSGSGKEEDKPCYEYEEDEAAVEACCAGQKINDSLIAMLNEQAEMIRKGFVDAITETLTDDKSPNPIYIPKHIQHRKKGRR